MKNKLCNYLYLSLLVNFIAILAAGTVIAAQVIFFFIDPKLLQNRSFAYFFLVIGVLFIAGEFYANWFFKKMEIEENYYWNNSLMIFKKHYDLCKE